MSVTLGPRSRLVTPVGALTARSLLAYDQRDVVVVDGAETVQYPRVKPISANPHWMRRCGDYLAVWQADRPNVGVHWGAVLSGGAAISCAAFRDRLVDALRNRSVDPIVGGEMEGVGLIGVGRGDLPLWGVIKGVSDFADEARVEHLKNSRKVACENAVRFALGVVLHDL
jgi:adenosylhomocysteine nucleosidase